jgi:PEP-CTERM motif-containing protein
MRISRRLINSIGLAAAGLFAAGGAAHAQNVQVSRTSDYTATWSGSDFSGASAVYGGSTAWSGTFTGATWTFAVLPGATGLTFNEGDGITITSPSPLTPTPPYPSSILVTFNGDGTTGEYWGWSETSAATNSGPLLTYGKLGSLETLTVTAGGDETLPGQSTPMDYYVNVFLPGDWTTEGTSTGNYDDLSWNPLFSTPTFTYDSGTNTTTVSSADFDFIPSVGGGPELSFTLIGSAIPEPSTWAMLLIGFAGLGYAGYRSARETSAKITA